MSDSKSDLNDELYQKKVKVVIATELNVACFNPSYAGRDFSLIAIKILIHRTTLSTKTPVHSRQKSRTVAQ